MRRFSTMIAMAVVACVAMPASAQTLLFDFGFKDGDAAASTGVNVVLHNAQSLASVVDISGGATTVTLTLDAVNSSGFNEIGPNSNGTTTPGAPANILFNLEEITRDSLFGHNDNFNTNGPRNLAIFDIGGLSPSTNYDFSFYAARAGDTIREAIYTVDGVNSGSAGLDAHGNTDDIAEVFGIQSTAGGTLKLTVAPGNTERFFYLGGMHITPSVPEPGSLLLATMGGLTMLGVRRKRR